MSSPSAAKAPRTAAGAVSALEEARWRTLALVASVSDADLECVHSPLMSPLVWDLAHVAAYEDLWLVHRYGKRPLLREDLAATYDAFETPRALRGDIELLDPGQARDYLTEVHARTLEVIDERGVGDGTVHEMVLRHEHQHDETMLQTLQLARPQQYELVGRRPDPESPRPSFTGLEMVEIPAGPCTIGAGDGGFAYDNERPRHATDVPAYRMGRTPVTNATYLTFVESGGYERRECWSDEGWAWKEQYDITRPGAWSADHRFEYRLNGCEPLQLDRPVIHVSWFE
ncbi:MAG: DinB family protein, partial [Solirubrobacterales bacterium]|nr:DinB family protein [Solirubrobacterales bacterium]